MASHMRLKAALSTAVLASSLTVPFVAEASTPSSPPTLPDLTAALNAVGLNQSQITQLESELTSIQGLTGGTLAPGSLSVLSNTLQTLSGGLSGNLLSSLLGLITSLGLPIGNPASATNIEGVLNILSTITTANGASTAAQSAAAELEAALSTAGLGQLLSSVQGLQSGNITSALASLGSIQGLPIGGSAPAGSLAPVGALISSLASTQGLPAPVASALTSAAGVLSGSGAISPAQLLGAIASLQTAAGGLSAGDPLTPVISGLVAQLSGSGSLFGGLAAVGAAPSTSTITGALSGLGDLSGLAPGASTPAGSLAQVASLLATIAGEPGVPAPVATTLTTIASQLSGSSSLSPTQLLSVLSSLNGVSGLPAPLQGLVTGLAGMLGSSGSTLGDVPGLSPATVTSLLTTLAGLPQLASGASIPAGELAPLATVLTTIGNQAGVPAQAKTILGDLATVVGSGSISPATLSEVITFLKDTGSLLPAPLSTTVIGLANDLAGAGSLAGFGTGTGSTGTGSTGTGTGSTGRGGTGSGGTGSGSTGTGTGSSGGGAGSHSSGGSTAAHATVIGIRRVGNTLLATVRCAGAGSSSCLSSVSAANGGSRLGTKTIFLHAGRNTTVRFSLGRLASRASAKRHRVSVKITAQTGTYKTSRTASFVIAAAKKHHA